MLSSGSFAYILPLCPSAMLLARESPIPKPPVHCFLTGPVCKICRKASLYLRCLYRCRHFWCLCSRLFCLFSFQNIYRYQALHIWLHYLQGQKQAVLRHTHLLYIWHPVLLKYQACDPALLRNPQSTAQCQKSHRLYRMCLFWVCPHPRLSL